MRDESELESLQCFPFHVPETGEKEGWEKAREERLIKRKLEELSGVPWEVRGYSSDTDLVFMCKQGEWKFRTYPLDSFREILDEDLLKLAAMVAARWAQGPREVL